MTYWDTVPSRLRLFAAISLVTALLNGLLAIWIWQVGAGIFVITEILTFIAIANSTHDSVAFLDPVSGQWKLGIPPSSVCLVGAFIYSHALATALTQGIYLAHLLFVLVVFPIIALATGIRRKPKETAALKQRRKEGFS